MNADPSQLAKAPDGEPDGGGVRKSGHRGLRITLLVFGGLFLALLVVTAAVIHVESADVTQDQQQLDPFYAVEADQIAGVPGSIVRSEPLAVKLTDVSAFRVVYRTRSSEGTPRVSGAMILVPTAKPPADGRKIVAWAHPTLGMGDACAPSRSADTLLDMGFAQEMINNGWVITATDYAGVGTQGTGRYLVGQDEANDVAFSVAMAHNFPAADTSKTWAVYGHSQGGHSALWTGELGESILPDFKLVGTAAVAPAAELEPLIAQQWDKPAQWSIGPDFIVGWSSKYPNLPLNGILTDQGSANYQSLSQDCIVEAALEGHTRAEFGQSLFTKNPLDDPAWSKIAQEQTPPPMRPAMPTFIVQGTGDTLVLPNTQAELSERWCRAGSDLSMLWLDGASHLSAQSLSGTAVSQWIQARFDGRPASSTCGLNLPVKPYGSNR